MQNIIKNVVKIKKNVKKRKKRDINRKRKKRFLHLCLFQNKLSAETTGKTKVKIGK